MSLLHVFKTWQLCKLNPYPASVEVMCLFVASWYKKGISGSSVKMYMAAIRYSEIAVGLGDPQMADWPKLDYVVRGVKKKIAGRGT